MGVSEQFMPRARAHFGEASYEALSSADDSGDEGLPRKGDGPKSAPAEFDREPAHNDI